MSEQIGFLLEAFALHPRDMQYARRSFVSHARQFQLSTVRMEDVRGRMYRTVRSAYVMCTVNTVYMSICRWAV